MKFWMNNWRRILLIAAVLLFAGLAYHQRSELVKVKEIVAGGTWGIFAAALGLQLFYYLCQGIMFRQIMQIWLPVRFRDIMRFTLSSNTANKIAPSGGISGLVLFMAQAKESGVNTGLSLLANILFYITDYLSFLILVWLGFFFYSQDVKVGSALRLAVVIFSAIVIVLSISSILLIINLQRFSPWLEKILSRVPFQRPFLQNQLPRLQEILSLVTHKAGQMTYGIGSAFSAGIVMQLTDVAILYLCFVTIGYKVSIGTVVAGFGLATVISLISMVPQGIAIYETTMTWIYVQMGIPFEIAITVSVLYRMVTFWFAMLPGIFSVSKEGTGR